MRQIKTTDISPTNIYEETEVQNAGIHSPGYCTFKYFLMRKASSTFSRGNPLWQ